MLADVGIESIKLPPRSPNLNAYAERFVKTIKESCLERMILFGEDSLRNAVQQFVEHYHRERNHQALTEYNERAIVFLNSTGSDQDSSPCPCGYKVLDELPLRVRASVDFGEREELGVGTENQIDTGRVLRSRPSKTSASFEAA